MISRDKRSIGYQTRVGGCPDTFVVGCVLVAAITASVVRSSAGWPGLVQSEIPSMTGYWLTASMIVGGCVQEAVSAVERERSRLLVEKDAFQRFAGEVATVEAPVQSTNERTTVVTARTTNCEKQCRLVRNRYRETVMAVPHYEEEYAETLQENMAVELNQDLATAVSTDQHLSPQLIRMLVGQARIAAQRRDELLSTIDREQGSLSEATTVLREIEPRLQEAATGDLNRQSFSTLVAIERDLQKDIDQCEEILSERQCNIQSLSDQWRQFDHSHFYQYLYSHLDVTYPAMNATLDRIRTLQNRRRKVIRALTCH